MAYKTLIFGVDDLYPKLEPFYKQHVELGTLEIVAFAVLEKNKINLVLADGKMLEKWDFTDIDIAMISSKNDFYNRMKFLESQGVPRNRIIDGRIFKVPNLDFLRLLRKGIAYGVIENEKNFAANSHSIYPQHYTFKNINSIFCINKKSYISINTSIEGHGLIVIGKICSMSKNITFSLGENFTHNYRNVSSTGVLNTDWAVPTEFLPPQGTCKILIGNDVWCGRGVIFKSGNPEKPLIIGDGAVIASDSVVVKDVPPYAIVGGNPAQIIKYRFPPNVIESLLRIKWWDWSLDKIHDNFKYFNDIDKFISLHDK